METTFLMSSNSPSKLSLSGTMSVFSITPVDEDKPKPKRSRNAKKLNPYFIFCKERRSELHSKHPSTPSREITKLLAEEWKNMNESEKKKYVDKHKSVEEETKKDSEVPQQINTLTRGSLSLRAADGKIYSLPVFLSTLPPFM